MTQNEAPAPAETQVTTDAPVTITTTEVPPAPAENTQSPPPVVQSEAPSPVPAPAATAKPAARLFTIRDIAPNEFRVFDMTASSPSGKAIGKILTPQDAAVVLAWLDSLAVDVDV